MQGLADGYFVLPYTVTDLPRGREAREPSVEGRPGIQGRASRTSTTASPSSSRSTARSRPRYYHKALGKITWEKCGMARDKAGLEGAIRDLQALRDDFWKNVKVVGSGDALAPELERAGRVADFLDFGIMMCLDALTREESCGGHFRTESPGRRRGQARRRAVRPRRRLGNGPATASFPPATSSPSFTRRPNSPPALTSNPPWSRTTEKNHPRAQAARLASAPRAARRLRGALPRRRADLGLVPRDDGHAQRAAHQGRARTPSRSTTTAARASAACAR